MIYTDSISLSFPEDSLFLSVLFCSAVFLQFDFLLHFL